MKYQVNVSAEAKRLIEDQVRFIAIKKHEPQNTADWAARVDVESIRPTASVRPAGDENVFSPVHP